MAPIHRQARLDALEGSEPSVVAARAAALALGVASVLLLVNLAVSLVGGGAGAIVVAPISGLVDLLSLDLLGLDLLVELLLGSLLLGLLLLIGGCGPP